jgi:hypothetical protein
MDYEFWFWIVVSFIIGHYIGNGGMIFYVGTDKDKYDKALIGVLIGKE